MTNIQKMGFGVEEFGDATPLQPTILAIQHLGVALKLFYAQIVLICRLTAKLAVAFNAR